jgi:hypothetical protein
MRTGAARYISSVRPGAIVPPTPVGFAIKTTKKKQYKKSIKKQKTKKQKTENTKTNQNKKK